MNRFVALCLYITLLALNGYAEPVSVQTAKQVGQSFLSKSVNSTGLLKSSNQKTKLELIYTAEALQVGSFNLLSQNGAQTIVPFYVFSSENSGYIIVSGDNRATPILGYANEGSFDPKNIPPNMQKWFEGYKSEIRYAIHNNMEASPETQEEWQALQSGTFANMQTTVSAVAPLISTKWNQSPYYNETCPYDNTKAARTVTGCVATAMAQVMKYWNYPTKGSGFHSYNHSTYGTLSANFGSTTYNWTSMPNQLSASSTSTQRNAVATLMYHCGVSVDMNYGVASTGGSSAYVITSASPITHCTEYALKTYFGYKNTLKGVKKANYTNLNWINLLKTELDASRPIVYVGFGDGGHCFVCDGYDNNNYFHFNWGWDGSYDGYFALNALNPGSGGIGGGSYSYNNGQQAVIGIEPISKETAPQKFDLQLYSNLSMSDSKIWFKNSFSLTMDVVNYGTTSFSGQFGAAVFDNNFNFIDFIETKSNMTLNSNYHYNNGLTFSNSGSAKFVPGKYYAAVFYKTSTQDWMIIANGNYTNLTPFEIYYSSDLETYSAFTITTNGGKLIEGKTTTVNVDVTNAGANTFYGKLRVNLANLDGTLAQLIQVLDENTGLKPNYHYTGGNNYTGTITVKPGTYLMEVAYQSKGSSSWYYAGSSTYLNPVYVIVEAPAIQGDSYENNDTQSKAYTLAVNFSGNNAAKNTNGSNLHIGNDIDYYKIVLPSGYNYSVTPRLHDNYDSGNGQLYTVDGLFSYSTNGTTYSETFDDVMPGNISVKNGGTLYFKVAPYFSGSTGNYLLDLTFTRSSNTGKEQLNRTDEISIFPNPAKDFTTIDLRNVTNETTQIALCDVQGKQLFRKNIVDFERFINIPLTYVSSGVYFIHIRSNKGNSIQKLIVKK